MKKLLIAILSIIMLTSVGVFFSGCDFIDSLFSKQEEAESYHECNFVDGTCTKCNGLQATEGLEFRLIDGGTAYEVIGYNGTSSEVAIPNYYNCKPVKSIELGVLDDNELIRNIILPDTLENMKDTAAKYNGGSTLKRMALKCQEKDGLVYLGSNTNPYFCLVDVSDKNITNANINENCKIIAPYSFHFLKSLVSVEIPDGVIFIGDAAFVESFNLEKLSIPNSIKRVGGLYDFLNENFPCKKEKGLIYVGNAFNPYLCLVYGEDRNMTSASVNKRCKVIGTGAFSFSDSLTSIVIPNSVQSIGEDAFITCGKLESLTIGKDVKIIPDGVFKYCNSLASITVHKDNQNYKDIDDNLYTKDGKTLIQYAVGKTADKFSIPDGVQSISYRAFAGCDSLTGVVIPDSVQSIGDSAFVGCISLTSIVIPGSVQSIGEDAFYHCASLTSVVIGNSVTSIGEDAFYHCASLTSVVIGNSVTSIGNSAFAYCSSLSKVYYKGSASDWDNISIDLFNGHLTNATRYYYIEKEQDLPNDGGNYWHYVDGEPTVWVK